MRLQNKAALVTGSARGLGHGMALQFAWEGATVGVLDVQADDIHSIWRVGQIDEVASVFLASDESSFVTGANYTVDGGLSVKGEQPQD